MAKMDIAIDGPAGAGKSTVAKNIATRLNLIYIDTGAMYRALTLKIINSKIDFEDQDSIFEIAKKTKIELKNNRIFLDKIDVTEEIRQPSVNSKVSLIAQISEIRKLMVDLQRNIAKNNNVIMDGRDIGTHVLPKASYKFFLTASIEERANRRRMELNNKGFKVSTDDIMTEIGKRDKMDSERSVSPLKPAEDAIMIDTTSKSIQSVVDEIITLINTRG